MSVFSACVNFVREHIRGLKDNKKQRPTRKKLLTKKVKEREISVPDTSVNEKTNLTEITIEQSPCKKAESLEEKSPKVTLDKLFMSRSPYTLACEPTNIVGLRVHEFTITDIVSQQGHHGLVLACVDNTSAK